MRPIDPASSGLPASSANDGRPLPDETVVARFLAVAAEQGDAPAVVTPEGVSTYADIARRAAILARTLADRGVSRDDLVMTIERNDFGSGRNDPFFFPMPALTAPAGEARDDYSIFAALAGRLGLTQEFTEGRSADEWLEVLYTDWRERLAELGHDMPAFTDFMKSDYITIPVIDPKQVLHAGFRSDPSADPLQTPSGRIEIFSEVVASYGYDDCPGHPVWREPPEWLGQADRRYPLHLIANQPKTRLHSQLDVGQTSQASKIQGREPVRMHPADAAARDLRDGDIVLIRNDRGSCLAGLIVSDAVRAGVVQLAAGAWYDPDPDPDDPSFCRHGNPNALTADRPSSALSQGTTAQHALVEVERWNRPLPAVTVDKPPLFVDRRVEKRDLCR